LVLPLANSNQTKIQRKLVAQFHHHQASTLRNYQFLNDHRFKDHSLPHSHDGNNKVQHASTSASTPASTAVTPRHQPVNLRQHHKTVNQHTKPLLLALEKEANIMASDLHHQNLSHKKEHFVIYSTSDKSYYKTFLQVHNISSNIWSIFSYMFPTAQYAKRFNYSYLPHPDTFNYDKARLRGHRPEAHYYRIYAALQLMNHVDSGYHGPPIDWLVYLDSDAFIQEPTLPLEAIVDAAAQFAAHRYSDFEDCHFITQEHGMIVNSGFYVVRNSEWSINFFKRWLDECEKPARDTSLKIKWIWDQGPLQNAILHVSTCNQIWWVDNCIDCFLPNVLFSVSRLGSC
jgi:hypothetical protein